MAIEDRMYDFSVRIAEIVRYLKENDSGFPLCDKLLDCVSVPVSLSKKIIIKKQLIIYNR